MPNYCNNIVHLRHEDPAQLTRVVDAYMRSELLNEFVPIDEEDPEWYELRLSKWGCKWDVEPYDKDNSPEVKDNSVTLMFDSPWSPPLEVFTKMVEEDGFDIEAYYYEPGMQFAGLWENGRDDYYEGWGNAANARKVLPVAIDEAFNIVENQEMWEEDED